MAVLISVIIPTKNNVKIFLETLSKLMPFVSEEVEVIAVNDGDSFEIPGNVKEKITLLHNNRKGVSAARNLAANAARGEVLFFIDDDMWVNAEAIEEIKKLYRQNLLQNSVHIFNWIYPHRLIEEMKKNKLGRYIISHNYHSALGRIKKNAESNGYTQITGIGSGSMIISKKIFSEVGGYNENIHFQGEDIELSHRLKNHNVSIYFNAKVCLEHNQSHRLAINTYLNRMDKGYKSEALAVQAGLIEQKYRMKNFKYRLYKTLVPFEKLILGIFKTIPNNVLFDKISFRLIDRLSGIQLYKNLE